MAAMKRAEKKASQTYEKALELIRGIGYDERFGTDCYRYLTHRNPVFNLIADDCRVYRTAEGSDPCDENFNHALCREYIERHATIDDIIDIIVTNSPIKPGKDSRNMNLVRRMVVMLKDDGSVRTNPWMNDLFLAAMINGELKSYAQVYKFILKTIPKTDPAEMVGLPEDSANLINQLISGKYNAEMIAEGTDIEEISELLEDARKALRRD